MAEINMKHSWKIIHIEKTTKPWLKHVVKRCVYCSAMWRHYYDIEPSQEKTIEMCRIPEKCSKIYNPQTYESTEILEKIEVLKETYDETFWCPYEHYPFQYACTCEYCKKERMKLEPHHTDEDDENDKNKYFE